jgi:hypothetical protein
MMFAAPYATPVASRHFIDLTIVPVNANGWQVVEHQGTVDGHTFLFWDPTRIKLYVDHRQKSGDVKGYYLREKLRGKPVLNAHVLDFLLTKQELIPESWKQRKCGRALCIFFWGTLYRRPNDDLYVRFLCWCPRGWRWEFYWLGVEWQNNCPAALWQAG